MLAFSQHVLHITSSYKHDLLFIAVTIFLYTVSVPCGKPFRQGRCEGDVIAGVWGGGVNVIPSTVENYMASFGVAAWHTRSQRENMGRALVSLYIRIFLRSFC